MLDQVSGPLSVFEALELAIANTDVIFSQAIL